MQSLIVRDIVELELPNSRSQSPRKSRSPSPKRSPELEESPKNPAVDSPKVLPLDQPQSQPSTLPENPPGESDIANNAANENISGPIEVQLQQCMVAGVDDAAVVAVASVIVLVYATGATIKVTQAWLNSPEGKKAIAQGAYAIQNGIVIAGKAITKAAKVVGNKSKEALIKTIDPLGNSTPANPDPNENKYKDIKKISSNEEANKIAKNKGYKGAEALKKDFVGDAGAKFNMMKNTKTGEIILQAIVGGAQIATGLFI